MIDWLKSKYTWFMWYVFVWAGTHLFNVIEVDRDSDDFIRWIMWSLKEEVDSEN